MPSSSHIFKAPGNICENCQQPAYSGHTLQTCVAALKKALLRAQTPNPDRTHGLYKKYDVTRLHDPDDKHINCEYFVLDWEHDRFTIPAMRAYAFACRDEYPRLALDLDTQADAYEKRQK